MKGLRTVFYICYVVFGAVIVYRMLSVGIRRETITGIVLGLLLIALGLYRLAMLRHLRRAQ